MGTIKVIKKWDLKSNSWNNKVNDEDKKMQRECITYGGKNVRVQFKVGLSIGFIAQVRIYIVGLDP